MRVHFDVYGTTQEELENGANRILTAFSDREPKFVTITAEPMTTTGDGAVALWVGTVEAQV
jgi:hypothetical protein